MDAAPSNSNSIRLLNLSAQRGTGHIRTGAVAFWESNAWGLPADTIAILEVVNLEPDCVYR